jgi:tetratricopeptide (TPR) repeat protein/cellulose biosynthesis protein BcsQ
MTNDRPLGNIITFYSYKGGTGRSMAVANVAWILASSGKRVLTVDWDLEAPGLHRYYTPFLSDKDLTGSDGLIDLLIEFRDATATDLGGGAGDDNWHESYADIAAYVVSLDWDFPNGGTLDFLPAGRQGASYSARVNSFDWEEFYERRGGGVFLETIKKKMRADYDYVLIDSRTGVSDTSGICTVQMPDAVVVCFTLNNQGIKGSAAVAHSIYEQRLRKSREIAIFPVPMRVEPFEKAKLDTRREYAKEMFKLFPAHIPPQSRAQFQEDTQVKYLPYYAYEEILATFGNRPGESEGTSLLAPSERLTAYLTDYLHGETISRMEASEYLESRRQSVLALFEGKQGFADLRQLLVQSADAAWLSLKPEDERIARRALLRLARLADAGEQSGDTRLLVRLSEFDEASQAVLNKLAATPLVTIERDAESGEAAVQLSSMELLRHWPRLQRWIQEDREFLLWRQKLNIAIAEWNRLNEDNGALLIGAPLEEAKRRLSSRAEDLNETETAYVNRSVAEEERRLRKLAEREEQEKRHAAEKTELEQKTEVLIKTNQQSQRLGRRRAAIVSVVTLLALIAAGLWGYLQWNDQRLLKIASAKVSEGNDEMEKGNFDKAIGKFTEAIAVAPSFNVAYYSRGRAYLEEKKFDQAIADFDEAIKLKADYAEAYVGRGDVRWQKGDPSGAIDNYTRAIDLNSKLYDAYTKRGKVLIRQKDPNKALADCNRAIELNHEDPAAFLWRGVARSMLNDYDGAFDDFNQALTLKQNLKQDVSDVYIKRGDAYLRRGGPEDNQRAISAYTQALADPLYDPEVFFNRGLAYQNTRQDQLASADYQKAFTLSQGKPDYSGINADALKRLREIEANQISIAHIRRGDALLSRGGPGDNKRAIIEYNKAIESIQYDPHVYLNRGIAYQNTGEVQLAGPDYRKAINLSQDKTDYASIKSDASKRLQSIQNNPASNAPAPPRIYLHFQDDNDRPIIDKISAALELQSKGSKSPKGAPGEGSIGELAGKPEKVAQATSGDVRYFHKEDEASANAVKQFVEKALKDNRIEKTLDLIPLLRQGGRVPQGWIEVWLPALPRPAYRPAMINGPAQFRPRRLRP